ncbi:MAG: sugar phosphate isomerase/epimerase family protein [Gemmataceae bacterium]
MNRRLFLLATGASVATTAMTRATAPTGPVISSNTYPWGVFAQRAKQPFAQHTDAILEQMQSAGLTGYEPIITNVAEFNGLAERLAKHQLRMPSLYVNSVLHDATKAAQSIKDVLAIAEAAVKIGVKIIVTNPAPIAWGGPQDKSDAELTIQAKALNELGEKLRGLGLQLAYHNHDSELRAGAREFHHMLTATDPANVRFCLDAHWVYRGCGNSQVALFDALDHYGSRIIELHLRQSREGVWTETFSASGDIDYARLAKWLQSRKMTPLLVLEQAVEAKTANTMTVVEAHRTGVTAVQALFNVG